MRFKIFFFNYCSVDKGLAFKTEYLLNKYFKDFPQQIPTDELSEFIIHPILVLDPY